MFNDFAIMQACCARWLVVLFVSFPVCWAAETQAGLMRH